jgi:hypothetical protein
MRCVVRVCREGSHGGGAAAAADFYGAVSAEEDLLNVMAEVITADWGVTPGYAKELSRQLVQRLGEKGYTISDERR